MRKSGEFSASPMPLEAFLLLQAKRGYGSEQSPIRREEDGSETIEYTEGLWRLHDNFFTSADGRLFFGRIVVFRDGQPYWYEQYEGRFTPEANLDVVNAFLHRMLQEPDKDLPVRGPLGDTEADGLVYELEDDSNSSSASSLEHFEMVEYIGEGDFEILYEGHFRGGLIK